MLTAKNSIVVFFVFFCNDRVFERFDQWKRRTQKTKYIQSAVVSLRRTGVKNPAGIFSLMRQSGAQRRTHPIAPSHSPFSMGSRSGGSGRLSPHRTLVPGPVAFVRWTSTPATAAGTKDGVPRRAAAVAPVGGVSVAPAPAAATATAEDATPRGDAGRAAAGGRTRAEVRDGSLSGTVGR